MQQNARGLVASTGDDAIHLGIEDRSVSPHHLRGTARIRISDETTERYFFR